MFPRIIKVPKKRVFYCSKHVEPVKAPSCVSSLAQKRHVAHALIEESKNELTFILTGSSARKLERVGANLLAGRAFLYNLFPLNYAEIGKPFSLDDALTFGTLPKIFPFGSDEDSKLAFLRTHANTLRMKPLRHTSYYGDLFEQYLICEIHRRNIHESANFELSYLATSDGAEIDLVIKRPDGLLCLVEIKSTDKVDDRHAKSLVAFAKDFPDAEMLLLSQDNIS